MLFLMENPFLSIFLGVQETKKKISKTGSRYLKDIISFFPLYKSNKNL
jgi:hypothetical protein